jgi:hypothetical protein
MEDAAAAAVYELFHGDLRGALRTLEQAAWRWPGSPRATPCAPSATRKSRAAPPPIAAFPGSLNVTPPPPPRPPVHLSPPVHLPRGAGQAGHG